MFDLRYHVASLAAVFLALIIGILVGVGISDRGLVDSTRTKLLEGRVASLQQQLDRSGRQSTDRERELLAGRAFVNEAYPVLMRNRLRGKKVAVVFVGSIDGGVRAAVTDALDAAGAGGGTRAPLRLRAVKAPIDISQVTAALAKEPAAAGLRGRQNVEALGRALGQELMLGGETPLWDALTEAVVQQQDGGSNKTPADGVVVVRTAEPQRGPTSRFLLGLYAGLASTSAPAVGAETTDAADSATKVFRQNGLSTVDDVDTPIGRLALALLLAGGPSGQYGVKDSAGGGPLPPLPSATAAGG